MVNNGDKENFNIKKSLSPTFKLFLGEYQPNITGGGRLALPKKIREVIGDTNKIVLARGFEECIFGYTKSDWEEESRKTLISPISERKSRMLKRYMFSGAYELDYDLQGRVVIPKVLLDYGNLEKSSEVILVGAGDHFEIWNKHSWKQNFKNIESEVLD